MKTYEELLAECDALSAKLQKIDDAWMATGCWPTTVEEKQALANAINSTPAQCLAEVKAESGRSGYELGAMQWCFNSLVMGADIESSANQYAAKIRNGETK